MSAPRVPLAIWLLPDDPTRDRLQPILDRLASRWNAPRFAAHVTVHVGDCAAHLDAGAIVEASLVDTPAIALRAAPCEVSAEYFRTLYLPLEGGGIVALRASLLDALSGADPAGPGVTAARAGYRLEPHLSLLYARLDEAARARLLAHERDRCRLLAAPTRVIPDAHADLLCFDRVALVKPARGASDLSQVRNWQVSEALPLRA